MILAALFDMDGLMIDSNPIISKSYEIVLKEYGKTPKLNEIGLTHTPGISAVDNWRKLIGLYGIEENFEVLAEKKNIIQKQLLMQGVSL